jgi:hypothetical protein
MEDNLGTITPFTLSFTIAMGILIIVLPRKIALLPLIIACSYITVGQKILIFDKDLNIFRILLLFGWVRLLFRGELTSFKFNAIDKALIWWVIAGIILGTLLDTSEFVSRIGFAYNAIGLYFLFRFLIRDLDDIEKLSKILAIVIVPLAITMIIEKSTARNIFSVFGGVPDITMIRDGSLRCQGPFRHPILAGTFGATLMPLFASFWFKEKTKLIAIIGISSSSIITFASASSGPALAYAIGLVGFLIWPQRQNMRMIRWGIVSAIIALHLIMKDPVWYIFARLSILTGGAGWHRSMLIDTTIRHFNEWWLVGTTYTAHWFVQVLPDNPKMIDITNQYIYEGVSGGVVKLILFITIIALSFRTVGLTLQAMEDRPASNKIMVWSIGISLLAHVVSFISVCYFDQMIVFWYLLLSIIATLPNEIEDSSVRAKSTPEPISLSTY